MQTGRPAMAAAALETSTRNWSSDAVAWQQLAVLYAQLGRQEQARQALLQAKALDPSLSAMEQAGR